MREFAERALATWREKRDDAFAAHGLNKDKVYAVGDFTSLPADCLMAVCYVDAYASMVAKVEEIDSEYQRLQNGKIEIKDGKVQI